MTQTPTFDLTPLSQKEREGLAAQLSEEERAIILFHGTEPPFCGGLLHGKGEGTYLCRLCGLPLFRSSAKFDSGTGWPSFYETFAPHHVRTLEDRSMFHVRTEIRCARCDGHLGHVFPDGPPPTGERYCLNSLAMEFLAAGEAWPDKLKR